MTNWTAGYVAEVDYTYGYYTELNPLRATLALPSQGLACPHFGTACELGFGQGLSTNFHGAASNTRWYGTDFNPAQAGFAMELAEASTADVHLYDQSFAEFCSRDDLPQFDFIGLHGIWSWVSDENRQIITEFIGRKLKVGGVLYVSYNTLPGWASFAPMRHLMSKYSEIIGSGRGMLDKVGDAIEFAEELIDANALYSKINPLVAERVKKLKGQDRHYLAHEYFNSHWYPMHFSTMVDWLAEAKVNFACSAHYLDHVEMVNTSEKQQELLNKITDNNFRQAVRDFITNQQFRRDYWVKGPRSISLLERAETLQSHRVMLISKPEDIELKAKGAQGEATLNEAIYNPLLELMSDYEIRSLGEIVEILKPRGIDLNQVVQAAMILTDAAHMVSAQSEEVIESCSTSSRQLNTHIMSKARSDATIKQLASPVSGGGIPVSRFQQLFLMARQQGKSDPKEWADLVWSLMKLQGQRLVVENKTIESEEESIGELVSRANDFATNRLPILKALGIA